MFYICFLKFNVYNVESQCDTTSDTILQLFTFLSDSANISIIVIILINSNSNKIPQNIVYQPFTTSITPKHKMPMRYYI